MERRPHPEALALDVLPIDLLESDSTTITAAHPDVLQILREDEVAALPAPAGVTSVFPYGFVVRRVGSTSRRTVPASPTEGDFAGIVRVNCTNCDGGATAVIMGSLGTP